MSHALAKRRGGGLNSLLNNTILDQTKLKAFAGNNFNVILMVQFFIDRTENIVGKGENAGY